VIETDVENVVLVLLPGGTGAPDDGAGVQVTDPGTMLPERESPVRATEPESVTVTAAVPVPVPPATARSALTCIWFVTSALLAVVLK
jgi:hypothetical protein